MDQVSSLTTNLNRAFLHMKGFYQVVKHEDLTYAKTLVVSLGANRFERVYPARQLGVKPLNQVGRSSVRANKQRETVTEIAKYWIKDENPCRHSVCSITFIHQYYSTSYLEMGLERFIIEICPEHLQINLGTLSEGVEDVENADGIELKRTKITESIKLLIRLIHMCMMLTGYRDFSSHNCHSYRFLSGILCTVDRVVRLLL